jgi:nucleoside-diphosphate-sugar epimerase
MAPQKMNNNMDNDWSIEQDLQSIFDRTLQVWSELRDARIFITGGTGFIGCWLLESLLFANKKLDLNIHATILTRSAKTFEQKIPHLFSSPFLEFIDGNVCDFILPPGDYSHVIHAATDASAELNENNPLQMYRTVIDGTLRTLKFAVEKKSERVLFLSSGAVYGQQPWELLNVPESYLGGPNCVDARATYAEAKRAAEMLCAIYQKQFGLQIAIARIFALLGPYLSLGIHFAAGNFIRDAMQEREIVINGNGMPCRSYLYASDLTVALWHLLIKGEAGKPYNVGSSEGISIKELAEKVTSVLGGGSPKILGSEDTGWNPGRYVPSTALIESDLNLKRTVSLEQAILRTAIWNGWKGRK